MEPPILRGHNPTHILTGEDFERVRKVFMRHVEVIAALDSFARSMTALADTTVLDRTVLRAESRRIARERGRIKYRLRYVRRGIRMARGRG